ncbi:Lipoprotein activator of PBP from the outer membrane B [Leminorella richardii]|uniref:Penicillin-binding protein activator LpoB n=1 Tax=Leminorella richardii TaxID=158841 RepID=A0A2X4V547_9GAMM|nr:penicillin-binding protein activator LpoB [Leminorella richardii]SQI40400.1 Lipoprotein activator of PBP from the outer membrane B [Leminorella richardii]
MKKTHWLFLVAAMLALTGCQVNQPKNKAPVVVVPPAPPPYEPPPVPPTLPEPEKAINWVASVEPLVAKMVGTPSIESEKGILLLEQIKNNTSGRLASAAATEALKDSLASTQKFELVPDDRLQEARQALGIQGDDSLISRSKAMSLARYLGAKYIVYASANGSPSAPEITIQLMQTATGEIIWSGQGETQR